MLRKSNFNHSLRVQGILDSKGVLNKARLDEVKAENHNALVLPVSIYLVQLIAYELFTEWKTVLIKKYSS